MADQAVGLFSPWLRRARISAALPYLTGRVLDYGCGVGALASHVPAVRYLGFDHDAESIQQAVRHHPHHAFTARLPEGDRFDTVVALALIEHLDDPVLFLRRCTGLLRDGGRLVLTTPHPRGERAHALGARLGLFSRAAASEHERLLDQQAISGIAFEAGLRVTEYRRFLLGFNQLAVLELPG